LSQSKRPEAFRSIPPMRWLHLLFSAISLIFCDLHLLADDEPKKRPNVVFILADDLGWGEVGCFGQQKIPTPNIDQLAAAGMRLTRHYSGAPVCAPSRCVLMTGRHLGHAEIRGNQQAKVTFPEFTEGQHPISESAVTMAMAFRNAGYATGAMGKWGLGPVGSTGAPNAKGFDFFFGYNCQAVAHSYYPRSLWKNSAQIEINPKPISGHHKPVEGNVNLEEFLGRTYAPKLMIAEAEKFIADHKSHPFFLYLPFIEPHVAMHPPQESVDRFPREWDTEQYKGQCGYLPHPRPRAAYAAMISDLDSYVGRVIRALKTAGIEDNTLIVFSSDNGTTHEGRKETHFHIGGADPEFFNSTAGLRGYKGSVYEGGLRVPTIVCWSGQIAAGSVSEAPGYFADWFPTLAAAAGLKQPEMADGENLLPTLLGQQQPDRQKPLIWIFPEYGGQIAVRWNTMKIVRTGLKTRKPGPWEVYDLTTDPSESLNIASSHEDLIQKTLNLLKSEVDENSVFPIEIPATR
ncbi:MAG: arylsulfatase, partial [Planctomycetota bacterium]